MNTNSFINEFSEKMEKAYNELCESCYAPAALYFSYDTDWELTCENPDTYSYEYSHGSISKYNKKFGITRKLPKYLSVHCRFQSFKPSGSGEYRCFDVISSKMSEECLVNIIKSLLKNYGNFSLMYLNEEPEYLTVSRGSGWFVNYKHFAPVSTDNIVFENDEYDVDSRPLSFSIISGCDNYGNYEKNNFTLPGEIYTNASRLNSLPDNLLNCYLDVCDRKLQVGGDFILKANLTKNLIDRRFERKWP